MRRFFPLYRGKSFCEEVELKPGQKILDRRVDTLYERYDTPPEKRLNITEETLLIEDAGQSIDIGAMVTDIDEKGEVVVRSKKYTIRGVATDLTELPLRMKTDYASQLSED